MDLVPCIYVLYSGKLYGTEKMTIKTALGTSHKFLSIILTPPGLVLAAASDRDTIAKCFNNDWDLFCSLKSYLVQHQKLVFVTTTVYQSFLILLCNLFYRRQIVHLHIVHGGTEEHLSYGRKSLLNYLPVKLIAVSNYVRERLEVHKVRPCQIKVVENFLLESEIETIPKRQLFQRWGITQVIIVSRLDPIKRIDLLFDTLDSFPELNSLEFNIFGFGVDMERLKIKVQEKYDRVSLNGFSDKIWQAMANSDLLLHLCPVEPFGLAILEAMAIGLPVLAPNTGSTKTLVTDGVSGFHFNADDKTDLALSLSKLQQASPKLLNSIVYNARQSILRQYSEAKGIAAYLELFDSS